MGLYSIIPPSNKGKNKSQFFFFLSKLIIREIKSKLEEEKMKCFSFKGWIQIIKILLSVFFGGLIWKEMKCFVCLNNKGNKFKLKQKYLR